MPSLHPPLQEQVFANLLLLMALLHSLILIAYSSLPLKTRILSTTPLLLKPRSNRPRGILWQPPQIRTFFAVKIKETVIGFHLIRYIPPFLRTSFSLTPFVPGSVFPQP